MTQGAVVLLTLIIVCFSGMIITFVMSYRNDIFDWNKKEKEANLWLEEEKKKPRWRVKFNTTNDNFSCAVQEPDIEYFMGTWIKYTSETRAIILLQSSYSRNYFIDGSLNTYPACNVVKAWVERDPK